MHALAAIVWASVGFGLRWGSGFGGVRASVGFGLRWGSGFGGVRASVGFGLRWRSLQSKRLSPLSSWVRFLLWTHVKRVCQRSAESRGFSPGDPVSSHRES